MESPLLPLCWLVHGPPTPASSLCLHLWCCCLSLCSGDHSVWKESDIIADTVIDDKSLPESTQLWSVIHVETWTVLWILKCTIFLSYPWCYHVLLVTVNSERGEAAEISLDGGHLPPKGFPRLQARTVNNVALWWRSDPSSRFHNLSTSPKMSLLITVVTTVW